MTGSQTFVKSLISGNFENMEVKLDPMYQTLGSHVSRQSIRLGKDFVIAQAVFSKNQRQKLRTILGSRLIFIVICMTPECSKMRLKARHGDSLKEDFFDRMEKFSQIFEKTGENEESTYDLVVTEKMSAADVLQKALEIIGSSN